MVLDDIGAEGAQQLRRPQTAGSGGQIAFEPDAFRRLVQDTDREDGGAHVIGDVRPLSLSGDDDLVGGEHALDPAGQVGGPSPARSPKRAFRRAATCRR